MPYLSPNSDPNQRALASRQPTSYNSGISPEWSVSTVNSPGQFMEYWTVIRASFGWMCLLALVGMAFGWLYATLRRPMYEARTVLDIRSLNENFLNTHDTNTTGTTDSVLPESYIQTEIKILQSDSLKK